ncbi:MAG: phosphate signaling complex protein PhoU [Maricaulaceae bacterium]
MSEHTVRAFGDELDELSEDIARMGGLAEYMVSGALDAVAHRDASLAREVVERDPELDEMQRDIERQVIRLLALRQPFAQDLRDTIAALKISSNLERIGDLAKNIAKRAVELVEIEPVAASKSLDRMGRNVTALLKEVLDAYASGDAAAAKRVWVRDEEVDERYNALLRELLTYMMEDPRKIGSGANLLFMAKNLERIGDHATNVAEVVHYRVTGEELPHDRPRGKSAIPPAHPSDKI